MEQILEYIKPELIVLIPVLYFIGMGLKKSSWMKDKIIPVALGVIGILLSAIYVVSTSAAEWSQWYDIMTAIFTAVVQGVLVAGCSTFFNQIYKQIKSGDVEDEELIFDINPDVDADNADAEPSDEE